ncbi:MAG: hypothetical protein EBT70_15145 [Betaproteobacteria bacterium]|nr:hypothetical protein [Betaproteobacteria bacterium]
MAVVGRPNVGKSTLINTWLGEERMVAFDMPGTATIASRVLVTRLNNVDLPTLGRPTMAMTGFNEGPADQGNW